MSDNIIKQHPGAEMVSCLFDQSMLDTGLAYPADMSGLPTSTPNAANLRRKSRRSWFEKTPKGTKFDIAVEQPQVSPRPTKRNSEDVEVLTLTHFTGAPRLGFGNLKPGQTKTCTLMLRNPHDYEQTVKIEKVPEKKHFSVPIKEMTVGAGETFPLDITWKPEDVGGVREMLLMQVDSAYRLQAYVFGTVVAPPPKRKTKRTGLLASKATKPFSVIQTNSLANINHEYSQEKKPRVAKKTGRPTATSNAGHRVVAQPLKNRTRKSGEAGRRSARLSTGGKHDLASKENCTPTEDCQKLDGFVEPAKKSKVISTESGVEGGATEVEYKTESGGRQQEKKKLRRSNTYNNVSVGMIVPVIKGAKVRGMLDTSLLADCDISGIQALDETPEGQKEEVENQPSFMAADDHRVLRSQPNNVQNEPSFLEVEQKIEKCMVKELNAVQKCEPSFLEDENSPIETLPHQKLNTSFDVCDNAVKMGKNYDLKTVQNPKIANLLVENYHDSLESSPVQDKENLNVELPSFLADEKPKQTKAPRRSLRRRSRKSSDSENVQPAEVRLLKSAKRRSGRGVVKSEAPSEDTKAVAKLKPKARRVSNDSTGQSFILSQLKNLKSYIHEKSYEIESGGEGSFTSETYNVVANVEHRETFVKGNATSRFSMPSSDINIRRGTFVTDATKMKLLETQKPSEASPRRTTYTLVKKSCDNMKSPFRSHSEGRREVTELRSRSKTVNNLDLVENILEEEDVEEQLVVESVSSQVTSEMVIGTKSLGSETKLKQRFSADSLEAEDEEPSFEKQFGSPKELPADPDTDFCRRSTLTVTKSRPSDALMRRTSQAGLFRPSPTKMNDDRKNISVIAEDGTEASEGSYSKPPSQNSTFEVSSKNQTGISESSFPSTPLPNSPQLDHSRRSTHIIEVPKVLNLSRVNCKQLFRPVSGLVQYDDSPDVNIAGVDGKCTKADVESPEDVISSVDGNMSEDHPDISTPPSANTRRTLSAKRSLSGKKQPETERKVEREDETEAHEVTETEVKVGAETEEAEQDQLAAENGQLFFVPFDKKVEPTEKKVRQTIRRDPRMFLKKRSNPVTKAEDKREAKRVKCTGTEVAKHSRSATVPAPSKTGVVQNKGAPIGRAKRAVPTSNNGDSTGRQVFKPKTNLVKGMAQSKLILVKKSKTALPKHPMPFAAKNMYYDERWMEKQERGFVNWLNFILTPSEEYKGSEVKVKVDAGKLAVEVNKGNVKLAPTNEVLSFRAYSAHRKLNRLRKSACRLFQSETVIRVIQKIESEVESRRLMVRKDKMLHADLGAKQKILDMFISYNPLWLRVGVETIFGEVVPLQTNSDVYGLSRFIITRLLFCPDIALEFAHPTVPHLYRDGYAESTARHTLKKFLLIVYFLDVAKQQRIIEHNPCLFCKDSEFKASKDLLLQFSRNFLSGEGDITRHLGYLGYKVNYTQTALDEFDFAVSKLAVDLRDGLRLTRVLELLCQKPDLSRTLRVPAISRLQKVHNVEVVFKTLSEQGLPTGDVTTRDIVDGHRERTLKLLWMLIFNHQVGLLLNEEQLREEVEILQRSLRLKNKMERLLNYEHDSRKKRESHEPDLHTQSPQLNLLLRWCRCICALYNIKIENFTVSFSDGRALCHILHYYHPGLLPLSLVHQETSLTHLTQMEERTGCQNLDASINDSINSSAVFGDVEDPEVFQQLLANEKENFKILFEKVKELGGIPLMLKWSDMSNTIPDEKVVVTYLLYLCARLLDIRHESRAARVIQLAWRQYSLRKVEAELKVKHKAATVIQGMARRFLAERRRHREDSAVRCIQRVWRGHQGRRVAMTARLEKQMAAKIEMVLVLQKTARMMAARRRFHKLQTSVVAMQRRYRAKQEMVRCQEQFLETRQAVIKIQAVYRGHMARGAVRTQHNAVTVVQSCVRMFLAKKRLNEMRNAARSLQKYVRSYLAMRRCRQNFQVQRSAAVTIQSAFRGQRARNELKRKSKATTVIQSYFRMFRSRQEYIKMKAAATTLQKHFRAGVAAKACRREFLITKGAAITIQAFCRGEKVRRCLRQQNSSARLIQSYVRMYLARKKFVALRNATKTLQVYYRANMLATKCRQKFLITKGAAITIQAFCRGEMARRCLRQQNSSARLIQSYVRMYLARKKFVALRNATKTLQVYYRANMLATECRQKFLITKGAAITIQAFFRGEKVRRCLRQQNSSARLIQSYVRMYLARKKFVALRNATKTLQVHHRAAMLAKECRQKFLITKGAALTVQAFFRGEKVRRCLRQQNSSARLIQSYVRMYLARKKFVALRSATKTMQVYYRANILAKACRQKFLITKGAAITIQAFFRGEKVRRCLRQQNSSAQLIQSYVRMYLARKKFVALRNATKTLQVHHRAAMLAKECRQKFLITKGAALTIQAFFRGEKVRRCLRQQNSSARLIQSYVRMYLAKKKFVALRNATKTLQVHYKANMLATECRQKFLITKGAAIMIQAIYRGFLTRRDIRRQSASAVVIQSMARMYLARKQFMAIKVATETLQKYFRAYLQARECRNQFLIMKGSAIVIQSAWRGHVARKSLNQQHCSATMVQSMVRMFLQRKRYHEMKQAVRTLEAHVSARLEGKRCRQEFLEAKMAATSIQACFRGHVVRKDMRRQHTAATCIQACVRMLQARARFCRLKSAALTIQKYHRVNVLTKSCRQKFLCLKSVAVTIQSFYRGYQVRRDQAKRQASTTVIQASYRMFKARTNFLKTRSAIIAIQRYYRNKNVAKSVRRQFLVTKGAAITVQSAYRGYLDRRDLKMKKKAATIIQASYKMHAERKRYRSLQTATRIIQVLHRANMAAKACRRQFLIHKGAAISIQAHIRGHIVRKDLKRKETAATKIQSLVRMFLARTQFVRSKQAVRTIQKYFSANSLMKLCRKRFLVQKGAAITLQAVYRGFRVRQIFSHENRAAVCIQAQFRGYLERRRFLALKHAAILCQRKYRGKLIGHKIKANYEVLKKAVVKVQSAFRGKKCRNEYMAARKSAIVIQSYVRMMMARKKFGTITRAACVLQTWYRSLLKMHGCREQFLIQRGAAITLQTHIKGYLCRRLFIRYKAARMIQATYRMFAARRNYLHSRRQVVLCQTAARAFFARQHVTGLRQRHKAASVMQSYWRAKVAGVKQRNEFLKLKDAVCSVQSMYRAKCCMQVCRREFLVRKGAAITLQAVFKGWLVRKEQRQANEAAVCIQSHFRGYIERKRYTRALSVICTCQRIWKARFYGRIQHYRYLEMREAAAVIQSCFRMRHCQKRYQKLREAVVSIQSWYRGTRQQQAFNKNRWAACVLQDRWRAELLCRRHVMQYMALKDAAVLIQSRFRGKRAREDCHRLRAVVQIQSFCRMWAQRRRFLQLRQAAVRIQCQARVLSARRCLERLRAARLAERRAYLEKVAKVAQVNLSAMVIQRCYRNHVVMKAAQEKIQSIVLIQRWFRTCQQRLQYLKDRRSIVRIQACVRMWLARRDKAARIIQGAVRGWLGTFEDRKKRRSATTIQARWRGFILRKKSKSKKMAETRRRVIQATESATEEKKLGNRTASALDYLLKYKHLSQVLDALMHLEVATRLAWVCCERLVEANAVSVLYRLVRCCNRSLPHMEVIRYTICILLNLAKYEKTRYSLYEDYESVSTLIELMQIYRENKGPIFTKTCTLLGILALDVEFKTTLMSDTKAVEKLRSIRMLTARKHKLEENQRVTRAKMNATLNTSCMVRQPTKRHSIRPAWSLHKDRMNEIENPLRAIDFVLINLGVATK